MVEAGQDVAAREQAGHRRIEIDQGDVAHAGMLQHLARGEAVAAAEDQHLARFGDPAQRGMHQRLVIAIFVARRELEVAVEEQLDVVAAAGEHDPLEGRRLGIEDRLLIGRHLGPALHPLRPDHAGRKHEQDQDGGRPLEAQLRPPRQHHQQGQGDRGIGDAEQEAGADHAEMRHQDQRKEQGGGERADIVEGEDGRHDLAEVEILAQDPHQQRDFEPDEEADRQHQAVERDPEMLDHREQHEQGGGREAAEQGDQQLDADEQPQRIARARSASTSCPAPSRTDRCR